MIAPGAAGVDEARIVGHGHFRGKLAHHLGRRGNFADRFLLDAQTGDDRCDHRRRHFSAHDAAHERKHFFAENLAVLDNAG
ncbi:hypothetical protein D3C83_107410 [compost metagenome]